MEGTEKTSGRDEALMMLGKQFEGERDAEYQRFRSTQRPVRISPWNPRTTDRWDRKQHEAADEHMRRWSMKWWKDRGYEVVEVEVEGDTRKDAFTVRPLP